MTSPDFYALTPDSFYSLIESYKALWIERTIRLKEKQKKVPKRDYNIRFNDKGTLILTVRNREPKYLTKKEINELAKEFSVPQNILWVHAHKKKILITHGD
jgi:predicted nuclease of restriction endonuclease-like RecB superfamily